MYPPPVGKDLTAEQARELDDTYLSSNPFEYFRSKIASLIAWHEHSASPAGQESADAVEGSIRVEFNRFLQRAAADGPFRDVDVHAQVAADALAIRHHAAEALLRLAAARLGSVAPPAVPCLWAQVAGGPAQISQVLDVLGQASQRADSGDRLFRALVPPHLWEATRTDPRAVDAVNVFGEWITYAATLLNPGEINLQAAHNKVKHGLAVHARADMRVTFVATPPSQDGTVPVSAFTADNAIDIFDQPVLELLAQGPKVDGHPQGLELTQLRLKPSALLADAFMLAMTHGAMFHVASVEHFAGRDGLRTDLRSPDFPGLPSGGPRPIHIDATAPLGMRFPITTPPGGGPAERQAGIGYRTFFQPFSIDYDGRTRAVVVDG